MILDEKTYVMNSPLFIFKRCPLAAAHNARVLWDFNYNLDKIIKAQHPSQISYGSEFRPSTVLEKLLIDHPFWNRLKEILERRASFPLTPINNDLCQSDLAFHRNRGNHKSLLMYASFIDPVIAEDIDRGFALPLPIETLQHLLPARRCPLPCSKGTFG